MTGDPPTVSHRTLSYRHYRLTPTPARLIQFLHGPYHLRAHLLALLNPAKGAHIHQSAILDALDTAAGRAVGTPDHVVGTAVLNDADNDPWTALRGGWAAELVEPLSRLVDALEMTFTEEEIRFYAHLNPGDDPFEITDEQLDRMEDHAVADSRFAEGVTTPEGMALWADVVAADFLVKEATRLKVADVGKMCASELLRRARARWQRFEDDPDGMATTAIAKAAAEHGYPQISQSHQPTRMADLWSSWSPQKEPLGEPLSRADLPALARGALASVRGFQTLHLGEPIETGGKLEWPEARYLAYRSRSPLVVHFLAWVWWKGRWRAKAGEALQRLRKVEAATVRTVESVVEVLTPGTVSRPTDDGVALVTADGREAGRVLLESVRQLAAPGVADVEAVRAVADELVRARARTAGVYSFLHAVQTVTELYRHGINDRAETWNDWKEWAAEVAELQGVKLTGELRGHLYRAAWFGNAVTIPLFGDRTQKGLWLLTAPDPFKRGRRPRNYNPRVTFSYAPIFSPEWANDENRKDRNRGVRLLAIPTRIPIGIRNPARHAAAQLYSLSFMAEVAANARDTEEGALLALPTVHRLAVKHGLGEEEARAQLTALMDGGLIEEHGKDRYRLGTQEARDLSRPKGQRMKGPKWKR